ncbi:MAG: hypothetical protein H7Z15_06890 [Rhizobacter sp.]|nr:hypothetical protein [Rhizobacter sp.]
MTAPKVFSFATMMVRAQRRHAARLAAQESPASQPQRRDLALRSPMHDVGSFIQRITLTKGKHA